MKKTILIGLLLALVVAAQAQITIWGKYYKTASNQETGGWDTIGVAAYPTQFQKGEIDSITLLIDPYFSIEDKDIQLRYNAQYALHYSIYPTTEAITWQTGNPLVAIVRNGVITAIGNGATTITGTTQNGRTQSVNVKVADISVAINLSSTILHQGEGMPISATIDAGSGKNVNCIWSWDPQERASIYLGHTLYGNTCGPLTLTATADTTDSKGQYIWHNSINLEVIAADQEEVPPFAMLDSIRRKQGADKVLLCVHFDQQPCYGMQYVRYNELSFKNGTLREVDADLYPGWYYIVASSSTKCTFVQESLKGRLNTDFQTGDASTWQYVGGFQAEFGSTDDCAAYFIFPKAGVYTYRSTALTATDCAMLDTIDIDWRYYQVCDDTLTYLEWNQAKGNDAKLTQAQIDEKRQYFAQQWVKDTIEWYNQTFRRPQKLADIPDTIKVGARIGTKYVCIFYIGTETTDVLCHTEREPITETSAPIRSMRKVSNPETGVIDGSILLWKDGQQIDWNKYYIYPHNVAHNVANLDSISFVRYTTDSIWFVNGGTDTVHLQNMADPFWRGYSCPIMWRPYFSYDSLEYELTNPEVVSHSTLSMNTLDGRFATANQIGYSDNSYGGFGFYPNKKGETELTIRCGNVQTTKRIVVEDADTVIYATADSLLKMIYNRMAITGREMPSGWGDIPGLDEGTTAFYRGMWELNEFPADHIWWIWNDLEVSDLQTHKWDADNSIVRGIYRRLYYNIDLCNQYLQLTQSDKAKTSERAEVRFMRAFYYSYLLDLFGNVPIITKHALKKLPAQNTRKQLFQFVVEELEQATKDMPEPGYRATNYRADKVAAWLLLSRVYLNSEIYCDSSYMDKAAEYAYKVIRSPYNLASNYENLFMGDNNEQYFSVGNNAVQEIILSIDQNPKTAYSYGGSLFLIAGTRISGMPDWGLDESWWCARSKTNLVQAFTTLQNAATIKAANTAQALGDDRAMFCSSYNGQNWNLISNARHSDATYFYDCWAITKYTNLGASSSYTPSDRRWSDMDIPIMRKAEAYLTYAEAVLRGGATQGGYTSLSAVNELRIRAHATEYETISLAEILNEWAREFYTEGRRRMDLIRFGVFSGQDAYNWEGKNGQNGTTTTTIDSHYNLYPIPNDIINWNPNLTQNPGY